MTEHRLTLIRLAIARVQLGERLDLAAEHLIPSDAIELARQARIRLMPRHSTMALLTVLESKIEPSDDSDGATEARRGVDDARLIFDALT